MEAGASSLLLDEMACSHESDDVGTSRVVVRQSVPKATSSGGGPESVTDTFSSVMPTGPSASTAAMKDGENSANNDGGGDTQTLSSLQATVKLLSDQMAWFVDRLKEPEAELDSVVFDGAPDCAQPEGEAVEALNDLGNAYADIANLGTKVDGQLATIVNNILTSRMTDEKRKEKMEKFIRPAKCDKLEITRVNPEIWEKLSAQARARDQRAQRVQKPVVQAMVAMTSAVDESRARRGQARLLLLRWPTPSQSWWTH